MNVLLGNATSPALFRSCTSNQARLRNAFSSPAPTTALILNPITFRHHTVQRHLLCAQEGSRQPPEPRRQPSHSCVNQVLRHRSPTPHIAYLPPVDLFTVYLIAMSLTQLHLKWPPCPKCILQFLVRRFLSRRFSDFSPATHCHAPYRLYSVYTWQNGWGKQQQECSQRRS